MNIINNHVQYNRQSFGNRVSVPKNLPSDIVGDIVSGNISKHFVPTPEKVVELMINELGVIKPTDRILEPSAGCGHICDVLVKKTGLTPNRIDTIEPIDRFRKILKDKGYNLVDYDVQRYNPSFKYDKIIMNPPFDHDIIHVMHCFDLLKPKGKLVSILSENAFVPPKQVGYEKWVKDWLHDGNMREPVEYLQDLLKKNDSKVYKLKKVFLDSDVPDDVQSRMIVITKR